MKKKNLKLLKLNKKLISNIQGRSLNGGSSDPGTESLLIIDGCGPVSITICESYCNNDCESHVCTVTLDRYCDANVPTN